MPTHLVDNSAFARYATRPAIQALIDELTLADNLATCGIVDLEVLYSAPSPPVYRKTAAAMRSLPRVAVTEAIVDRALAVQALLAERSQHRGVPLPDLLIAACAESAGLTLLHYDADFDRIAELTDQPTQWVVPRGSAS
jgi:predicted nucleic acid-binding protein